MDALLQALTWLPAVGGLGLAVFGAGILLTGKAPARTMRGFRRPTDAGMYTLCTGLALILLTVSSKTDSLGNVVQMPLLAAAVALGALGFIKYRPRDHAGRSTDR